MDETMITLLAGLDLDASQEQILKDILSLQRRLNARGAKIEINAELAQDLAKSIKEIGKSSDFKNIGVGIADSICKQFNIVDKEAKVHIKNLVNQWSNIRLGEIQTGSIDDALLQTIDELGKTIISTGNIMEQRLGIFDAFYDYFKKLGNIKISSSIKENLGAEWKELKSLYPNKFVTEADGIELDSIYQELSTKFKDIFSGVANPTEQFKELTAAIRAYRNDVDTLKPLGQSIEIEDSVFESVYRELAKLETALQMDNVKESITAISDEASTMEKVEDSAKLASQQKEKFADANREVRETAEDTTAAVNREVQAFLDMNDLDQILANINMHGQQGNSVFQAFGTTLRDAFYVFTAANLLEDAIREVIDAGKESVEVVKELSDAATSLRMATGSSYESVKALITSYNAMGQEIGALTTEVSDSADAWLRQGHTLSDTNTLIKDSMMLSKVSNMDAADSTKYLTSAMQGYKTSVEEVVAICDRLVNIDLVSATDAAGLAEAMSRTAEGANIAGISMDRLLGMIATVGEVTQKSMSSIGESYKTIFSRMRDIKDNKLQVVGDDGEIEDLSNVEVVLGQLGIKLRESNKEFRNFQEVLDEVASGWDNYSSVQQAAIAKAFSGVRNQENFLIMMSNWDKVQQYTKAAENSTGMTEEKFGYYLDSLEAKTKSLQASLENLASTTISEDLYASILDTAKSLTDATTESGILKSSLTGLASAGALYTFQQLGGFVHNCAQEFSNLSVAMNMVQVGNIGQVELQSIIDLTGGLSQSQTRLLLSTNTLTDAQRIAILMNQGLSRAQAEAQIQTWGLATAQNGLTTATISLGNVMHGLWSTLMANPLILVATGVTAGVTAFNKYKQSVEEAKQATKESATKATELSAELSNLTNEYLRLSEEVKENAFVKDELLGVQDDLLEKLGLEKSELDELIDKYGSYSEAIKNASIDKLKESQVEMISGLGVATDEMIDAGKDNFWGTRNNISAKGEGANKAFEVLEQAGIVGIGEDLFLNGDDTVEGVLENYAKLESALEALRNSNKFKLAELSDNPLYKAIYDRWSEMKAPVEEYRSSIEELNTNQAAIMTLESLKGSELPDTQESFEAFKQGLIDSATASKDFIGTEEEIIATVENYLATVPEFAQFYSKQFKQMEEDVNSAASALSNATKSQAIEKINSLADGFSALQDIYKDISSDDGLDIADLSKSDFTDTFSGVTESYENFISVVTNSPNDIKACQAAFDNLLFSWLNSEDILSVLNDETIELMGNMLEEQGIANASAWLHDELSARKQFAAGATTELSDATATEIIAFFDEMDAADGVKEALARLELAKITVNGTAIDTSGDVSNLIALAEQANATKEALASMKSYQKISQDYGQTVGDDIFAEDVAAEREGFTNAIKSTINYKPSEGKGNATNSGSGYQPKSNSTSKSSSSAKDPKQEDIDWIARRNELLKKQHDLTEQIANDETISYNERKSALLDLIEQDKKRVEVAEKSAENYKQAWLTASEGLTAADKAKIAHDTDDIDVEIYDAQELADKGIVESLEAGEKYIENLKLAIDYYDLMKESEQDKIDIQKDSIEHQKESIRLLKEEINEQQALNSALADQVNSRMELHKAQGQYVGAGSYEELIRLSEESEDLHRDSISALEEELSGAKEYSSEWYGILAEIEEAENAIIQCQAEQAEFNYQIARLPIERIQMFRDLYSDIIEDMDNYRSIQDKLGLNPTKEELEQYIALYNEQVDSALNQQKELQKLQSQQQYGSDKYKEIADEIQELDNHINATLTSMTELNHELLQIPLTEMAEEVDKLSVLKDKLNASIAEDNAKGLQTTVEQYAELNQLTVKQLEVLTKQRQAIVDVMGAYDKESQFFKDAQSDLDSIDQTISDLVQQQYAWNSEILKMPVNRLNSVNDNLNSYSAILGDVLSQYQSALDGINSLVDSEIEDLEKQLSLIEQVNRARQVELDIEQSLFELNRAREQRNIQVIREGKIVYENDKDAERQAQANYQDSLLEKQKFQLEEQITQLETIKDKWSEIVKEKERAAAIEDAESVLGSGWQEAILSGNDDSLLASFKDLYSATTDQKNSVDKQIESNERLVQMMEEISARYQDGSLTYESALNNISTLINASKDGYDALENLSGMMYLDNIASLGDIASSADSSIKESAELLSQYMTIIEGNKQSVEGFETSWESMAGAVQETVDSFNAAVGSIDDYLSAFQANANAINEHTSTFEELSKSIREQVEALKKAAQALEEAQHKDTVTVKYERDDSEESTTSERATGVYSGQYGYLYKYDHENGTLVHPETGEDLGVKNYKEFMEQYEDELKAGTYHKGIFKGAVKSSGSQFEEELKTLAQPPVLKQDEVIVKAQEGELIYRPEQIVNTIKNAQRMVLPKAEPLLPHLQMNDNTGLPMINNQVKQIKDMVNVGPRSMPPTSNNSVEHKNIEVNFGGITLNEVQNPDEFAQALKQTFESRMNQNRSKVFK